MSLAFWQPNYVARKVLQLHGWFLDIMTRVLGSFTFMTKPLFALLLWMPAGFVCSDVFAQTASEYQGAAMKKYEAHDYDGAIADCTKELALDPKNAEAYDTRGSAKFGKLDFDGAIADYTQALTLDPETERASAYYGRGDAKYQKGDLDGAIADYTQGLALDPKNAFAYFWRGHIKAQKRDWDGAIADYTQALTLDPKHISLYYILGDAKFFKGDLDGAMADFTQGLALDPKDANAYNGRGAVKQAKGDFTGAVADYNRAIALAIAPNDCYTLICREQTLRQLGSTPTDFSQTVAGWKDGWLKSIGQYMTGSLDEGGLLAAAAKGDAETVADKQCMADYFIGMMRLQSADTAGAREFFQKCLATDKQDFTEYQLAKAELARLDAAAKK